MLLLLWLITVKIIVNTKNVCPHANDEKRKREVAITKEREREIEWKEEEEEAAHGTSKEKLNTINFVGHRYINIIDS